MQPALWLALLSSVAACKEREPSSPKRETPRAQPAEPPAQKCKPGERTCVGDALVQCKADGSLGDPLETCKGPCRSGACVDTCALQDVELIYLLDDQATLFSFDPKKLPGDAFHKIAAVRCDTRSSVNSMAVDRYGVAWLGYHNGAVHRVSIFDGQCASSGGVPRGAPTTFGMGFVSDGPKSTTEKLFVAGGPDSPDKTLATLDTSELPGTWKPIATIEVSSEHPELTGTGDGRVFAYFPSPGRGFVQELDRATARPIGTRWTIQDKAKHVSSYAFAHWGGVFYIFTTADENSAVHAIHMKSGKQELVKDHLPIVIVGAGVSTCAPLLERAP